MSQKFSGTGVALITPFNEDSSIDFEALGNLIEFQIENGTDYLVVLGTTGEPATMTPEERKQVIDFVIEKNAGRLPIVVGIGGNNTAAVCNEIKNTNFDKIDGILSVVPYYNKPTQEGIFQHFMAIAEVSPRPIILYNVPGRTGVNMEPSTTLKLANASDKFVGIKEASGNLQQIEEIIKNSSNGFSVISGDDAIVAPLIKMGGCGVISVMSNGFPREMSELVKLATINTLEADLQQQSYKDLIKYLFIEGNPAGVKAVLNIKGVIKNKLRLPLVPVSENTYQSLKETMMKLGKKMPL